MIHIDVERLKILRTYCWQRYLKAQNKRSQLFWINVHFKFSNLLEFGRAIE